MFRKYFACVAAMAVSLSCAFAQPTLERRVLPETIPNAEATSTLILSSDTATLTRATHVLAAESGTADDLSTVTTAPFQAGDQIIVSADTGDTITIKHGTGNITSNTGSDVVLSGAQRALLVVTAAGVDASRVGPTARTPNEIPATTLTLSTDAVTPTRASHIIAAESGTADDFSTATVTAYQAGDTIKVSPDTGDTITIKHGVGNITTDSGNDIVLDAAEKYAWLHVTASGVVASRGDGGQALGLITDTTQTRVLALADANNVIVMDHASSKDVTIPTNASVNFGLPTFMSFVNKGAGNLTITATTGVLLNGSDGGSVLLDSEWDQATLTQIAVDEWTLAASVDAVAGAGRELLTANRTYYVRTDGNDANDGLTDTSGGAFLTWQKAIDTATSLDLGLFNVTIKCTQAAVSFAENITLKSIVGAGHITLEGDTTTPSNVEISPASGRAITGEYQGLYILRGLKLSGTNDLISIRGGSRLDINAAMEYGAAGNYHIDSREGSRIAISDDYEITGGASRSHLAAVEAGIISLSLVNVTVTGTPSFSAGSFGFAYAESNSVIRDFGSSFTGAATGKRYNVITGGQIDVGGSATFFPGDVAGTEDTATSGHYAP